MCAINGFNFQSRELVEKMNNVTAHRGPDKSAIFLDQEITFGHNRLSIIDLSDTASQPMESNDGLLQIVFNGEIYNFKDIKKELGDFYKFKTKSDTEVILASYKKWGKNCVKKFNGVFAFAIWDSQEKTLFLARDQIGVKPLYYYHSAGKFIFSSEIKAILEHNIERRLNIEAFNHYLRVLYVPEPFTMFQGINKLPPASFAILKDGNLSIEKYWRLENRKYLDLSYSEVKTQLENSVESSVKRQLVSDRPLGIYLSGGIDSSIVLDCVSRVRSNIDTFSVGFELDDKSEEEKFNHDFYLARQTSQNYKTNHNEVILSVVDVTENLEKAIWHLDEPIANPTILPMYKLAGFAKKKADVVLGGDGGDETFGGYDRYKLSLAASYFQKVPKVIRNRLLMNERIKKLNTPSDVSRFALFMFQKDDILKQTVSPEFLKFNTQDFFDKKYFSGVKDLSFEDKLMNVDMQSWLVDESLMMTDKMSMSQALEARVPFLDRELVEFSYNVPLKYKISLFKTKIILKDAFSKRIPTFLLNQPKRGWFSPAAKWFRNKDFYEMSKDILSKAYCQETSEIFKYGNILNILEGHKNKTKYNLNILWSILVFQVWARKFNVKIT